MSLCRYALLMTVGVGVRAAVSLVLALLVLAAFWPTMSHMLDWRLFGARPAGHHLTSLLLHVANTLLVFLLLERMTGSRVRAALVALLFGLHPQHVESVAWIAERKDVLSALFWLLAIGAYLRYVRSPGAGRYAIVVLAMVAGLCAKPMPVTLPFTLLLLDWWPLRRLDPETPDSLPFGALFREKIPLLVLSLASSAVTVVAQRAGGAVASLEQYPFGVRVANAIVAYATYVRRTIWPSGLAVPYPHPGADLSGWDIAGAALVLAAVTFAALRLRRRHPYVLFGWLWFAGTLVPVIGLVQVGPQAMADRYTYVPLIGLFVLVAWGIPSAVGPLLKGKQVEPSRGARQVRRETGLLAVSFLIVPVLLAGTWLQSRHWRDELTLARRALAVTRNNAVAHNQMGLALVRRGRAAEALPHHLQAVELRRGAQQPWRRLRCAEQGRRRDRCVPRGSPTRARVSRGPDQPRCGAGRTAPPRRGHRAVRGCCSPASRLRQGPRQPGRGALHARPARPCP
jgi:hypothetical protein